MSILAVIGTVLSAVMTFTIQTKSTVQPSGDVPASVEAAYSCTYQKGDVRSGDEALLTVSGMSGIDVRQIRIFLKSNKSSGAGEIRITADESVVAQRSGSFKDWAGSFSTVYMPIEVYASDGFRAGVWRVRVKGTENSLHIEKYEITYRAPQTHTVTLMNGNRLYASLTEQQGGSGVLLPSLADEASARFIGWSETEFWELTELPKCYAAGTYYVPAEDTYLWSVWECADEEAKEQTAYVREPETGDYLYVNRVTGKALTGVPQDGQMTTAPIDQTDVRQHYRITFLSSDSATIQHVPSGTYIGYSGTKVADKPSIWNVYYNDDQTVFYVPVKGNTYVLWLEVLYESHETYYVYAGLKNLTLGPSGLGLLAALQDANTYYTCHPESPQGLVQPHEEPSHYVFPIGNYEMHITNGNKYLLLK